MPPAIVNPVSKLFDFYCEQTQPLEATARSRLSVIPAAIEITWQRQHDPSRSIAVFRFPVPRVLQFLQAIAGRVG